jgi:hypothetical protein
MSSTPCKLPSTTKLSFTVQTLSITLMSKKLQLKKTCNIRSLGHETSPNLLNNRRGLHDPRSSLGKREKKKHKTTNGEIVQEDKG